jgi:hypothetical protein
MEPQTLNVGAIVIYFIVKNFSVLMYICCAFVGAIKDSANNKIFVSVKPPKKYANKYTYIPASRWARG